MNDQPGAMTPSQHQEVVDSVIVAMEAYVMAIKGLDPDATIRFYLDDPDFRFYDGGQPSTYSEMAAAVRAMFGGLRSFDGGFESIQVTVLDPSAAVATSRYVDILTDTAGVVTRLHGTVSWTWVRRREGWRIMHGNALHLGEGGAQVTIAQPDQ